MEQKPQSTTAPPAAAARRWKPIPKEWEDDFRQMHRENMERHLRDMQPAA